MIDQKKTFIPLSQLVNQDKNPRILDDDDKARLKNQLKKLDQFKPLLVIEENGFYVALGGNMRLVAMRELVDEGHKRFAEAWVSIVEAKDDKTKLEYALSDNDRAGRYDETKLAELVVGAGGHEELEDYRIDAGYATSLDAIDQRYEINEQISNSTEKEIDEQTGLKECPKCGYEF